MPHRSSSMEHKVILLPNVKFWWGYNADDPHPLVDVSSSQRVNIGSAPPGIPVGFSRFHSVQSREICMIGNQPLYKIHQLPQEFQTEFEAAILSSSTLHSNSIRPRSEQSDEINSESQTFHWPSVDGPHPLTFDSILSLKLYSSLALEHINTAPTDKQTPKVRIKCYSHHENESTLLAVLLRFGAF